MAIFDSGVMKLIVDTEGGYVNDPDDPGGETKYGISKASYPHLDIENLTIPQAQEIYRKDFWEKYGVARIDSQLIANKLLIALINLNPIDSVKAIQRAVCYFKPIAVDGVLGSETLSVLNVITPVTLLLNATRLEYVKIYTRKVEENEKKKKYLLGWIRRALL